MSGSDILTLVDRRVFQPLEMKHSAQGLGRFQLKDMMVCQTDGAAPESGAGDPHAKDWDWNSPYWRKLGAPWGGGCDPPSPAKTRRKGLRIGQNRPRLQQLVLVKAAVLRDTLVD